MANQFRAIAAATMLSLSALIPSGSASAADMAAFPVKAKPIPELPFFLLIDNRFTYAYQWGAVDPGVTNDTTKQVFAFTHFDVWTYGTNFFNIGLEKAGKSSPANPCADPLRPAITGCEGATEIYGLIRSTIGFNEVFSTKAFSMGPLRNVSFVIGADGSTENRFFSASKRDVVTGLQFAFDLPYKGFLNVNPLFYYEFANRSTFTQCGYALAGTIPGVTCNADGNRQFDPTWAVELNYYMDLGFLPPNLQYFSVSGRAGFYGPKGSENGQILGTATKMEINSEPIRLTFDASKAMFGPKYTHNVDVWVAYRLWRNKFGLDEKNSFACTVGAGAGSCREDSLYSGVTVKF